MIFIWSCCISLILVYCKQSCCSWNLNIMFVLWGLWWRVYSFGLVPLINEYIYDVIKKDSSLHSHTHAHIQKIDLSCLPNMETGANHNCKNKHVYQMLLSHYPTYSNNRPSLPTGLDQHSCHSAHLWRKSKVTATLPPLYREAGPLVTTHWADGAAIVKTNVYIGSSK